VHPILDVAAVELFYNALCQNEYQLSENVNFSNFWSSMASCRCFFEAGFSSRRHPPLNLPNFFGTFSPGISFVWVEIELNL